MASKTKINYLNRNKLFNYGLHMNNKLNFVNTKEQPYLRFKNSEIIIKDPLL